MSSFVTCLEERIFLDEWKKQMQLVLPKNGKLLGKLAKYGPPQLVGMIWNKSLAIVEEAGGVSTQQNLFGAFPFQVPATDGA